MDYLYKLTRPLWRLLTNMSTSRASPLINVNDRVGVESWRTTHPPELLDSYHLAGACLVTVNSTSISPSIPHDEVVLTLSRDADVLYVTAGRTARSEAPSPKRTPIRASTDASTEFSNAFNGVDAHDRVLCFRPASGSEWWQVDSTSNLLKTLATAAEGRGPVTCLDVSLALVSVTQVGQYRLPGRNCWWYAACVSLLLEIIAVTPLGRAPDVARRDQVVANFFAAVPSQYLFLNSTIPGSLNPQMIREDVEAAEIKFRRLRVEAEEELIKARNKANALQTAEREIIALRREVEQLRRAERVP